MKISFNKRRIETACIILAFFLVLLMTFLLILAIADQIFQWDIFPPLIERIGIFIMISITLIIGACSIINFMVNFSLISMSLETLAEKLGQQGTSHGHAEH